MANQQLRTTSQPPSAQPQGRIFKFKQGLEDVKWGSIPTTVFGLVLLAFVIVALPRAATFRDQVIMVGGALIYIVGCNYAFYMWWRTPRTLIVTEDVLIGKRTWGKDLILPWSSITTLKRVLFHWKWSGLKVIAKPLRCQFIIGDEIQGFDELVRLIQYHVRRHNPSAQFIGLPALPGMWQPSPARPSPKPRVPPWLRFEVPTRRRSLRGPLTTGLGTTGLFLGLWQLATPTGSPRDAVYLTLLAMIVLVLGVLLWLVDWTKDRPT